jgi:hypothetical protein
MTARFKMCEALWKMRALNSSMRMAEEQVCVCAKPGASQLLESYRDHSTLGPPWRYGEISEVDILGPMDQGL